MNRTEMIFKLAHELTIGKTDIARFLILFQLKSQQLKKVYF